MIFHVHYATTEGPITVVYDTDLSDAWTVPQGATRITFMTDGQNSWAPDTTMRIGVTDWAGLKSRKGL